MKIKVTQQGVLIPKELLEGIEEVEVQKENNVIILTSTYSKELTQSIRDLLWGIRNRHRVNPSNFGIPDSTELIREDRER
ncbi:hypothetical protein C7H19_18915 [Aphanothece hegewaldii CCALA 016]|uniref:Uncharacterized protein n=1 Tax=Aphanothece hegewaldii CCALA 016 TaxID=2107694 RepID=A0A2T1LTS4_9CHRO|nr:hypothetical protein [Aphanothece hegewaldii]PSF34501.1 hypothetical protein C7H19_18915 [Aphanothece hegewaldii CCALA 016]